MTIKYLKDRKITVRINSEVKTAMNALGISPQGALDEWIQNNWEKLKMKKKDKFIRNLVKR